MKIILYVENWFLYRMNILFILCNGRKKNDYFVFLNIEEF